MLDIISTLFPAPSLEEVIASVNEDTPQSDVSDIDDILSSYSAHAFFEPVNFVNYPWFTKRVNPNESSTRLKQPAVSLRSWVDVLEANPDWWKALSKALEVHVRAQEGVGPTNTSPAVVDNPIVRLPGTITVKPLELHDISGVERKCPDNLLDSPTLPSVVTLVDTPRVPMSPPEPSTSVSHVQQGLLWCDPYLGDNPPHSDATWVAGVQAAMAPTPARNPPSYYRQPTSSVTGRKAAVSQQNASTPGRVPSRQTKPAHPSPLHENHVAPQTAPTPTTPPARYTFIAPQPPQKQGTSAAVPPAQTQRMHGFLRYSAPSGVSAGFGRVPAVQMEVRQHPVPGPVSSNPRASFAPAPPTAAKEQGFQGYYPSPVMASYNAAPVMPLPVNRQAPVSIDPRRRNAVIPGQAANLSSSGKRRAPPVENEDLSPSKKARMATTRMGVPATYRPPQSHPNTQGWPIHVR